jgi:RalA-binding protein 1
LVSHDIRISSNILDIEDKQKRVQRLVELVHSLPKVNFELLRIMSRHLKRIVYRAQENKMTIRNGNITMNLTYEIVGIVFSPTLNIPAPVFSLFITEYDLIFDEADEALANSSTTVSNEPPPYSAYNDSHSSPPTSHNHLGVPENQSHRRLHSADQASRSSQPPPSFPMHHQGYREQSYQHYPPQTYSQQHQMYSQYNAQPVSRWNDLREEANDLFG